MSSSVCKKERGYEKREITIAGWGWGVGGALVKWWNFTSVNVLSPPLDLSQSFILGRSYSDLSGLTSILWSHEIRCTWGKRTSNHSTAAGKNILSMYCWHKCDLFLFLHWDFDSPLHFWGNKYWCLANLFPYPCFIFSLLFSPLFFPCLESQAFDYDLTQHQISETA